jgi:PH (Pleckstrin Homology) domain-containing protein
MTHQVLFAAPWDQKLTFVTVVTSALLLAAAVVSTWAALTQAPPGAARAVILLGGIVALAVFVGGVLLAPRGYTIADGRLTVDRFVRPVVIPLESIETVERLPAGRLAGSWRTLGSGGFFGYYGRFRNQALGSYRMYATRGDGYVLVRAARPYVLTPDSPDRFIETLKHGGAMDAGGR